MLLNRIIITFLFLLSVKLYPQNELIILENPHPNMRVVKCFEKGSDLILGLEYQYPGSRGERVSLVSLDRNNRVIKDWEFDNERMRMLNLKPTNDGGFIFASNRELESEVQENKIFSKFNPNYEIEDQFLFGNNLSDDQWSYSVYNNDYLYIVGNSSQLGGTLILRSDEELNIGKSIVMPEFNRFGASSVCLTNDGIAFLNSLSEDYLLNLTSLDFDLNPIMSIDLPFKGRFTDLISYDNKIVFIALDAGINTEIKLFEYDILSGELYEKRISISDQQIVSQRLSIINNYLYIIGSYSDGQSNRLFFINPFSNNSLEGHFQSLLSNTKLPFYYNNENRSCLFFTYGSDKDNIALIDDFNFNSCYLEPLQDVTITNSPNPINTVERTIGNINDYTVVRDVTLEIIEVEGRNRFVLNCDNGAECDLEFSFPNFAEIVKLNFVEDALIFEDNARLTNSLPFETGAMWYTEPIPVTQEFSTEFSFKFSNGNQGSTSENSLPGADGIAFVFQSRSPQNIGRTAGEIGYGNIFQSLAIEIDLYENSQFGDPNGNHVAIQRVPFSHNSPRHNDQNTLAINGDIIEILADGTSKYYCKIEYKNKVLQVFIDDNGLFENPVLVLEDFDFSEHFELLPGDKAFVGFTSATGNAFQTQEILTWEMCAYEEETETSVEEIDKLNLIYPNPVSEELFIDDKFEFDFFIIHDSMGSAVLSSKSYKIDLDKFSNGIYFIEFIRNGQNIQTSKFIITK